MTDDDTMRLTDALTTRSLGAIAAYRARDDVSLAVAMDRLERTAREAVRARRMRCLEAAREERP